MVLGVMFSFADNTHNYHCLSTGAIQAQINSSAIFNGDASFVKNKAKGHGGKSHVQRRCVWACFDSINGQIWYYGSWLLFCRTSEPTQHVDTRITDYGNKYIVRMSSKP